MLGAFNPATNTGVLFLRPANPNIGGSGCGPNGITVSTNPNGTHDLLLGCTPGNNWINFSTQVINAPGQPRGQVITGGCGLTACAEKFADVSNITGSDEVWFNPSIYAPSRFIGDNRYYLGASPFVSLNLRHRKSSARCLAW